MQVLVPGETFQRTLIIASKAIAYLSGAPLCIDFWQFQQVYTKIEKATCDKHNFIKQNSVYWTNFVPSKPFQPNLTFLSKTKDYLSGASQCSALWLGFRLKTSCNQHWLTLPGHQ